MARKIFVAEDDPGVSQYLQALVAGWGYAVSACYDGEQVLARIAEEAPDLILMDVMLPDMDGITLCRRLKVDAKTRNIPVIIVTSLTDAATAEDAVRFGAADCLTKPFEPPVLKSKIQKALDNKPAA